MTKQQIDINIQRIPKQLKDRPQWVTWKLEPRNEGEAPTKIPYSPIGTKARANDSTTWGDFNTIVNNFNRGKFAGIGYEFDAGDPFCGIDLDGCRDPQTGRCAQWAKDIILQMDTYAEVSPSGSGVKLFIIGKSPMDTGKKKEVPEVEMMGGKRPAIEIYDWGRFFAVTGAKLAGIPGELMERQEQLAALVKRFWPSEQPVNKTQDFYTPTAVMDRASKYLAKMPPAVSGQGGHNATFHAACVLVCGFGLTEQESLSVLSQWNASCCQPPWSERDLQHKIKDAMKQPGDRGYLRNASQFSWSSISLPNYTPPPPSPEPRITNIQEAVNRYIESLRQGKISLISSGVGDLDYAVGGGFEPGEMVIAAARPSHGKSAMSLQCIHNWTLEGRPCLMISEEMSSLALGKRTLQFISDTPEEHWRTSIESLVNDAEYYSKDRAPCYIAESCGTAIAAIEQIEKAVVEHKIQCVIVDYAQILRSPGKSRYEEVTKTSIMLKQIATKHNLLVLLLCQLNRQIEARSSYTPMMSDIRDTGQLEQDADVIMFLMWPHKIDPNKDANEYWIYVGKNRNRAINMHQVKCRFLPSRQMILAPKPENHVAAFDNFNNNGYQESDF